jgi:uncharacterized protein YkwD
MRLLAIAVLGAGLAACATAAPPQTNASPALSTDQTLTAEMAAAVSAYRAQFGLAPVAGDPVLDQVAQEAAERNAAAGVMDHYLGGPLQNRLQAHGVTKVWAGENLVRRQTTVEGAVTWWRNSPIHDEVLKLATVSRIGVGKTVGPDGLPYWALIMASN